MEQQKNFYLKIKELKKIKASCFKHNKKLSHIKPFVFEENNNYFILSILSGSRENMKCEVKKYEASSSCNLPTNKWPLSFGGLVNLRIMGITVKDNTFF